MNEAVDKVIEQREAMDRGFSAGFVLSAAVHTVVLALAIGSAWLGAKPQITVAPMGFAVPLPPGGGGPLVEEAAPPVTAPAPAPAEPAPPAPPKPEPPPKVIKPPKDEPKKGLPMPDAKKPKVKPTPPPRTSPSRTADARGETPVGVHGATGTNSATPGLGLVGPVGEGVIDGTDPLGDWYLAGVQRKIWLIWTRQIKTNFSQQITVSFTIQADGSLQDGSVRVVQTNGAALLDNAAQRAVFSAAPFGPLPRTYGTNQITIQALFQPTP